MTKPTAVHRTARVSGEEAYEVEYFARKQDTSRTRQVFNAGIWWIGSTMNLSGSDVQILAMYS